MSAVHETLTNGRARATSALRSGRSAAGAVPGWAWLVLAAITLAGCAFRVAGIGEALYGDEHYTHAIVTRNGPRGIWHEVYTTSVTPPLHYYLAWIAIQLPGDDAVLAAAPVADPGHGGHPARVPVREARRRRPRRSRRVRPAGARPVRDLLLHRGARIRDAGLPDPRRHAQPPPCHGRRRQGVVGGVGRRVRGGDVDALHEPVRAARAAAVGALGPAGVPPLRRPWGLAAIVLWLPWVPGYLNQRDNPGVDSFDIWAAQTVRVGARLPGPRPAREPVRRAARRARLAGAAARPAGSPRSR